MTTRVPVSYLTPRRVKIAIEVHGIDHSPDKKGEPQSEECAEINGKQSLVSGFDFLKNPRHQG
jgi:hypothetical protein